MSTEPTFFTQAETALFVSMIHHLRGTIDTDWDAVSADTGMKNGRIARVRWNQIRRKKFDNYGNAGNGGDAEAGKDGAAGGKKHKDGGDGVEEPLVKKQRGGGGKKRSKNAAKGKVEGGALEEDEEMIKAKVEVDSDGDTVQ